MTIAQQFKAKTFPFKLYDEAGNQTYYENSTGYWQKWQYNERGNMIYCEYSNGYWVKYQYNERGNETYYEDSTGYWWKRQYDDRGNEIYTEDSNGTIVDKRPKQKVILTMDEIAKKFGITTEQLQIKKG